MPKNTCFLKMRWYTEATIKQREEAHSMMQNDKFTAFDLDDLIFGNTTLVPSER